VRSIDLNVDLGEGGSQDGPLIALASSANIACGGHAGDAVTMREAVAACVRARVAVGAHPGYEDRGNFGRLPLDVAPETAGNMVGRQVARMAEVAAEAGLRLHHVKPHGALYTQADLDPVLARAVVAAVARVAPGCGFYVPPGGELELAGQQAGLVVRAEGFVDRAYGADGRLVPRGADGAVIDDVGQAVAQALGIVLHDRVRTITGAWLPLRAATLCVHGDGGRAVEILAAARKELAAHGIGIMA
jgi:UPF0271 protein